MHHVAPREHLRDRPSVQQPYYFQPSPLVYSTSDQLQTPGYPHPQAPTGLHTLPQQRGVPPDINYSHIRTASSTSNSTGCALLAWLMT
jgi:hypothetical protein